MREKVTLGSLCNTSKGQVSLEKDTLIDYFDISSVDNISKSIIGYETYKFSEAPSRARKAVRKGNIIISTVRPNLNAVATFDVNTEHIPIVSTGFCVLECKESVDSQFVFNFCKSKTFIDDMVSKATGASYPAVSDKIIRESLVPLYSLEEQRIIASKLKKVADIITLRKKELEELDNLIKSRFAELSDEWKCEPTPLKTFLNDITYGFTNPMPDAEEGPWKITAKDVINGKVNYGTARKTTFEAFEELTAKSKPVIGDVLLTKDGTLGRCAVVEADGLCVNQSVAVLKCNERIVPKFLAILLQMSEYQGEMLKNAGGGTIKHIYITKVVDMLIMVPSLSQQTDFLSFVEKVDKLKVKIENSLKETELLFDGLMQRYFG